MANVGINFHLRINNNNASQVISESPGFSGEHVDVHRKFIGPALVIANI